MAVLIVMTLVLVYLGISWSITFTTYMEKKMNRLKKLGFKKIPGTEPGFHMYELTPAKLQAFDENFRAQASKRTSLRAHKLDKIK